MVKFLKIQEKIITDIEKYGWHSIHVLGDDIGEKYSYTIGLTETFNHSEIAISGVNADTCSQIFEEIVETLQDGFVYEINKEYDNILEGYNCIFKVVDVSKYDELFGQSQGYYKEKKYTVIQLFYPDKTNKFPWDDGYTLTIQEVL